MPARKRNSTIMSGVKKPLDASGLRLPYDKAVKSRSIAGRSSTGAAQAIDARKNLKRALDDPGRTGYSRIQTRAQAERRVEEAKKEVTYWENAASKARAEYKSQWQKNAKSYPKKAAKK